MNFCLLIIDVQQGLDDSKHGERSTPEFEQNLSRIVEEFRKQDWPIIHVGHDSVERESLLRPELPGNAFKSEAVPMPSERVFRKSTASAFVNTGLDTYLSERGLDHLILVGLTSDHCVSTTARQGSDLGYSVSVISDATAAHEKSAWNGQNYSAEKVHFLSLATLEGEFAEIVSTNDLLTGLINE
ncbi:MAG: cysteine hydrolase family protein [Verrucomicrobiota bacterium]